MASVSDTGLMRFANKYSSTSHALAAFADNQPVPVPTYSISMILRRSSALIVEHARYDSGLFLASQLTFFGNPGKSHNHRKLLPERYPLLRNVAAHDSSLFLCTVCSTRRCYNLMNNHDGHQSNNKNYAFQKLLSSKGERYMNFCLASPVLPFQCDRRQDRAYLAQALAFRRRQIVKLFGSPLQMCYAFLMAQIHGNTNQRPRVNTTSKKRSGVRINEAAAEKG